MAIQELEWLWINNSYVEIDLNLQIIYDLKIDLQTFPLTLEKFSYATTRLEQKCAENILSI